MSGVDRQLVRALRKQLEQRDSLIRDGAERVGWKLGLSERDRIGGEIGVGHVTSATQLPSGGSYLVADGDADLRTDAEIVVELGRDVEPTDDPHDVRAAIVGYGVALEICDIAPLPNEPHSVVATNVFHRAVAFGPLQPALPSGVDAELLVDGVVRASGPLPRDIPARLAAAARTLAAVGERLRASDRIITGLIVQIPAAAGEDVVARVGALAGARLRISAEPQSRS